MLPEHPLSSSVGFNSEILDDMVQRATPPAVRSIVESFRENMFGVFDLLAFPYLLLHIGAYGIQAAAAHAAALFALKLYEKKTLSEKERVVLDKFSSELLAKGRAEQTEQEAQRKLVHDVLTETNQNPRGKSSIQALLQAALVRTWSSLESFVEDLWEFSLNTGIDQLGAAAAERILTDQELQKRSIEGLMAQSIQIHLLARHGWNISGKLGTLLKAKCDFTSVQGINRAFAVTFRDKTPVPQLQNNQQLRQIELLRHLIVHRAGIVDWEYRDASKRDLQIGSRLELSSNEVALAANLIIAEGGDLSIAVQSALTPSAPTS